MSRLKVLTLAALVALPLAGVPAGSMAATAHNSQAGAYGGTKNSCAPTPGFPDDDECLSGAIKEYIDGPPGPVYRRDRYRPVPPPPGWPQ